MTVTTRSTSLSLFALMILGLSACTTTDTRHHSELHTSLNSDVSYEVKPGDRLSAIALKLTGNADHWEAIAAHNAITDPKTLAAGQTLLIPYHLLDLTYSIDDPRTADTQSSLADIQTTRTPNAPTPLSITTGHGFSVARGRDVTIDETATINIIPVQMNRTFTMQPIEPAQKSEFENATDASPTLQIKVAGTYYPKALYAEPANYAKLVGRVSPGTVFALESKVNAWYKVQTDEGIRYLRQSDGVIIR